MTKFSFEVKLKAVQTFKSRKSCFKSRERILKKTRCLSSTSRTVKEEYKIIQELRQKFGFSLVEILPYTSVKKSTFYYQAHRRETEDNQELLQTIKRSAVS